MTLSNISAQPLSNVELTVISRLGLTAGSSLLVATSSGTTSLKKMVRLRNSPSSRGFTNMVKETD